MFFLVFVIVFCVWLCVISTLVVISLMKTDMVAQFILLYS